MTHTNPRTLIIQRILMQFVSGTPGVDPGRYLHAGYDTGHFHFQLDGSLSSKFAQTISTYDSRVPKADRPEQKVRIKFDYKVERGNDRTLLTVEEILLREENAVRAHFADGRVDTYCILIDAQAILTGLFLIAGK
jgi:hypothetical protein